MNTEKADLVPPAQLTPNAVLTGLAQRVRDRLAGADGGRVLIGIAGVPGAGKTTVAAELVAHLNHAVGAPDPLAVHVPMDGYHLADVELERIGLRDRKGAPSTFDAAGYLALLGRLRENTGEIVYAPAFDRELEQPVAGSIPIFPATRVVVSEGNYLLLDGPWAGAREAFDEIWFVHEDETLRLERLLARHVRFGKTPDEARAWIATTDQPNADLIGATLPRADLVIDLSAQRPGVPSPGWSS